MPIGVIITGAAGRMGSRLLRLSQQDADLHVAFAIDRSNHPDLGKDIGDINGMGKLGVVLIKALPNGARADVIIDFSTPESSALRIDEAIERRMPIVIGTTGLTKPINEQIDRASKSIAIMQTGNYSVGVNVLVKLVEEAARRLNLGDWNLEIVERHHNKKTDAPSGTALLLANAAAKILNVDPDTGYVYGRQGQVGERTPREIGIHSIRLGGDVGSHEVMFGSQVETITLSHQALNRDVFAAGALRAAKWIVGQPPGRYTMADVLGL
ncbi:MAG TPA: 4-hydroxy-tetrahydrodipicolinate reductase [Planctomycetota bacterium]|nr:4-hydroxy-tetrahydrodipicolinate reductase [Planctomycetota bacterium]